jgi:FkbM family methyltransferase
MVNDMQFWEEMLSGDDEIRVIYQVGAHRAQELQAMRRSFPALSSIVLFDPAPRVRLHLQTLASNSSEIRFFPIAIGDSECRADFYVTDNDQMSSSLLPMKEHKKLFPDVKVVETVEVLCSPLDSIIQEAGLPLPDMLFLDVQGAEYRILASLSDRILDHVKIIYTETSTIEVYEGAQTFNDIQELLCPRFQFAGYKPCMKHIPAHGDAIFLKAD